MNEHNDTPWHGRLHNRVLIAMVLGLALGYLGGESAASKVGWMGVLFMRMLKMVIVPLVYISVTSGIASLGTGKELGVLGAKTLGYYMLTSLAAILVGQSIVLLIRPGVGANIQPPDPEDIPEPTEFEGFGTFFFELAQRFLPEKPLEALASGQILSIIGFAIFTGVAISHSPTRARDAARSAFGSAFEVMMAMTSLVMKLLPLGVFGLITVTAANLDMDQVQAYGKYVVALFLGLAVHACVTLPILLRVLGKVSPAAHFRAMREALLTAFSTSSSSATMPVTLTCIEERAGISKRISNFVIPVGATVNMDGTALYECLGVMFIAQALGVEMSIASQMVIVVTALAASIGAAGVPSSGLVMIFIVLEAVKMNTPEAAAIVAVMLSIDRPLDMLRTVVNIWSDSCGAAIIASSEGEELPAIRNAG